LHLRVLLRQRLVTAVLRKFADRVVQIPPSLVQTERDLCGPRLLRGESEDPIRVKVDMAVPVLFGGWRLRARQAYCDQAERDLAAVFPLLLNEIPHLGPVFGGLPLVALACDSVVAGRPGLEASLVTPTVEDRRQVRFDGLPA